MQKIKQNAKPVGASIARPHFKEMTLKKQKGITLIALIITIIVMLILVGVTINVSLNGGLFTKASEASKQMQVEADRETLLSAVVAAIGYDGKVDLGGIELPTGWTGSNGTYTSPKGNIFTVDENGKIEASESKEEEPEASIQLNAVQIAKNYYSDKAIINLKMEFKDDQIIFDIFEKFFQIELENDAPIEENILIVYNEHIDPYSKVEDYTNIEETGLTLKEILIELYGDGEEWEIVKMSALEVMVAYSTFNIVMPDNTIISGTGDELFGEGVINSCDFEDEYGYCYLATQLGTHEITIIFDEISVTDTVTITEF